MMSIFEVFLDVSKLLTFQYDPRTPKRDHFHDHLEPNEVRRNRATDDDESPADNR